MVRVDALKAGITKDCTSIETAPKYILWLGEGPNSLNTADFPCNVVNLSTIHHNSQKVPVMYYHSHWTHNLHILREAMNVLDICKYSHLPDVPICC